MTSPSGGGSESNGIATIPVDAEIIVGAGLLPFMNVGGQIGATLGEVVIGPIKLGGIIAHRITGTKNGLEDLPNLNVEVQRGFNEMYCDRGREFRNILFGPPTPPPSQKRPTTLPSP